MGNIDKVVLYILLSCNDNHHYRDGTFSKVILMPLLSMMATTTATSMMTITDPDGHKNDNDNKGN